MVKNLSLATLATSIVLLTGCAGGNSDPMNDKKYIAIITDVPTGICESNDFKNALTYAGLKDFITKETDNTTSCATYGKVNDGIECTVEFAGEGNLNCVIGFNEEPQGYNGYARQTTPVELYNTMELISVNFQ